MAALRDIVAWRLDLAHVDPLSTQRLISAGGDRYAAGAVVPVKAISGHRDVGSTDCPGTVMYAQAARPARRGRRAAAAADLRPRGGPRRHRPDMPACCRSGSRRACRPPRRGASPSPMPPARRWPSGRGTGTAVDATWTDAGADLADRPALDASRPVTARPAAGAFNDSPPAPVADVLRGRAHRRRRHGHRHGRVLADRVGAHLGGGHRPGRRAREGARRRHAARRAARSS